MTFDTVDGLDPKTTYTFTIAAQNALGAGPAIPVTVANSTDPLPSDRDASM